MSDKTVRTGDMNTTLTRNEIISLVTMAQDKMNACREMAKTATWGADHYLECARYYEDLMNKLNAMLDR